MSEILGEARILVVPDTSLFRAQLEEKLAFARKPIVVPITTSVAGAGASAAGLGAAATAQFAAQQEIAAKSAADLATALRLEASQAGKGAVVLEAATVATQGLATATGELAGIQEVSAGRTAQQARQLGQLERGAFSATASQFGLRGATLAASLSFIAASVAVIATAKSLRAAHDAADQLEIQTQALDATLGQIQAGQFDQFASHLAGSLEVSRIAADKAGAAFSGLLINFGSTRKEAQQTSEELVKTAANLAAFTGRPFEEASTAIQRGLAGNGRGLRAFRVFLDQSRVSEEALLETGKQHASALTRQELVQARLTIIQRDSAFAQNAIAEQQGTLIGQSRTLSANFSNLATIIGGPLNRALFFEARGLNNIFAAGSAVVNFLNAGDNPLHRWIFGQDQAKKSADDLVPSLKSVQFVIDHLKDSAGQLSLNLLKTSSAMKGLKHDADVLDQSLLKLETQPGGTTPAAIIANRQADIAAQRRIIAAAQAKGGAGSATDIKKAREKIKSAQAEIAAQQAAIASDQQKAADAAKKAADAAKAARDKADQALLDLFSAQQTRITDALINAGPKAAIALTIRLRNLFRRQREEARKQIKDLKTRRDTLAADTTEIITLNKQIKDLQKAQRDAQAQQAADAAQARLTHLEALLSIAETTVGTGDDRRALERIIRFDEARIAALRKLRHRTREQNAELDALRVDLAQREKALRDLKAQQDKNKNAAQDLFFSFLQAQQGFAANLLGNLIPGGKTGGLVGNASPSGTSLGPPRQVAGGFEEARGALSTRARIAGAPTGPSSGQAATTNELLRRILRTLEHLNTRTNHPEAARQRQTMNAAMDGVHGN